MTIFALNTGITPQNLKKLGETNYLLHYPEANANTLWSEMAAYERQAFKLYIEPFLGEAIYNDYLQKVENGTTLNTAQTKFLTSLRDTIAYFMQVQMLAQKISMTSSAGNVTNSPEKSPATSLGPLKFKLWNLTLLADQFLDITLALLEKEVKANNTDFNIWKNDEAYTKGKAPLFRTTTDFQTFQNIQNSRRTFIALLPKINEAVIRHIIPIIGEQFYNEVKTQYTANTLTIANALILPKIQRVLAKFTQYLACDDNRLILEADGFKMVSNMEGMNQAQAVLEDKNRNLEVMRQSALEAADYFRTDLRTFLVANADDYPTFKNSTAFPVNGSKRKQIFTSRNPGTVLIKKG